VEVYVHIAHFSMMVPQMTGSKVGTRGFLPSPVHQSGAAARRPEAAFGAEVRDQTPQLFVSLTLIFLVKFYFALGDLRRGRTCVTASGQNQILPFPSQSHSKPCSLFSSRGVAVGNDSANNGVERDDFVSVDIEFYSQNVGFFNMGSD
jgi:hypothetical protein